MLVSVVVERMPCLMAEDDIEVVEASALTEEDGRGEEVAGRTVAFLPRRLKEELIVSFLLERGSALF